MVVFFVYIIMAVGVENVVGSIVTTEANPTDRDEELVVPRGIQYSRASFFKFECTSRIGAFSKRVFWEIIPLLFELADLGRGHEFVMVDHMRRCAAVEEATLTGEELGGECEAVVEFIDGHMGVPPCKRRSVPLVVTFFRCEADQEISGEIFVEYERVRGDLDVGRETDCVTRELVKSN